MIEADAVLLKWSDEIWVTLIDECVAHDDKKIPSISRMNMQSQKDIKNQP